MYGCMTAILADQAGESAASSVALHLVGAAAGGVITWCIDAYQLNQRRGLEPTA